MAASRFRTWVRFKGDTEAAERLIPRAHKEADLLKHLKSFRNLKQHDRTVYFDDGSYIYIRSIFSIEIIEIYVPTTPVVIKEIQVSEPVQFEFRLMGPTANNVAVTLDDSGEQLKFLQLYKLNEQNQHELVYAYDKDDADPEYTVPDYDSEVGGIQIPASYLGDNGTNEGGYWAFYSSVLSVKQQYRYIIDEDRMWNLGDRIKPGSYFDNLQAQRELVFSLTRGDETVVTPDILTHFWVRGYGGGVTPTFFLAWPNNVTYDEDTQTFHVNVDGSRYTPYGYWVEYNCQDGLKTQYPYRYKDSERLNEADLIQPGEYSDTIPYFKIVSSWVSPQSLTLPISVINHTECRYDSEKAPGILYFNSSTRNDEHAQNLIGVTLHIWKYSVVKREYSWHHAAVKDCWIERKERVENPNPVGKPYSYYIKVGGNTANAVAFCICPQCNFDKIVGYMGGIFPAYQEFRLKVKSSVPYQVTKLVTKAPDKPWAAWYWPTPGVLQEILDGDWTPWPRGGGGGYRDPLFLGYSCGAGYWLDGHYYNYESESSHMSYADQMCAGRQSSTTPSQTKTETHGPSLEGRTHLMTRSASASPAVPRLGWDDVFNKETSRTYVLLGASADSIGITAAVDTS